MTRPRVVGIVNLTPDSFSDGGRYPTVAAAVAHAERLIEDGAALLDVGAESTRPGAAPLDSAAELARLLPTLRALVARFPDVPISVDTMKADVARAALAEGAAIINDVTGLRHDPGLAAVVADAGAGLVLMHSRGVAGQLADYAHADYPDGVVATVVAELEQAVGRAHAHGIDDDRIVLDPGLGFGKRSDQSVALLAHLDRLADLGYPLLVGPSRKRFIGELSGADDIGDRLGGTIAACVLATLAGARLLRVHDARPVAHALAVTAAILDAP